MPSSNKPTPLKIPSLSTFVDVVPFAEAGKSLTWETISETFCNARETCNSLFGQSVPPLVPLKTYPWYSSSGAIHYVVRFRTEDEALRATSLTTPAWTITRLSNDLKGVVKILLGMDEPRNGSSPSRVPRDSGRYNAPSVPQGGMSNAVHIFPLTQADCSPKHVKEYLISSDPELERNILGFDSWMSESGVRHFTVHFASAAHAAKARKLSSSEFLVAAIPQAQQDAYRSPALDIKRSKKPPATDAPRAARPATETPSNEDQLAPVNHTSQVDLITTRLQGKDESGTPEANSVVPDTPYISGAAMDICATEAAPQSEDLSTIPESSAVTPLKGATKKRKRQLEASLDVSNESSSTPITTDTPPDAETPAPIVKKSKPNSTTKRQRSKRKSVASGDPDITVETQPQSNEAAESRDAGAAPTAENVPTSFTKASPLQPPSVLHRDHLSPSPLQDYQHEARTKNGQKSLYREALWKTLDMFGLDPSQVVHVDSAIQLGDMSSLEQMIGARKAEMEKLRTELEEERQSRIATGEEKASAGVFMPAIMKAREILKDLVKSVGSGTR